MNVNGKDYPIYEMENKIHVWNHQPVIIVNDPIVYHTWRGNNGCIIQKTLQIIL